MRTLINWFRARTARELRWGAIAAGGAFAIAVLLSDFFSIAAYGGGVLQAISDAAITGPTIGSGCPPGGWVVTDCNRGWVPSISIRALGVLAIVVVGLCLYRASRISEVERNSN
jgi:hypothetical protein